MVASIRAGVEQVMQQDLGASVQEMVDAFQNCSAEPENIETPDILDHCKGDSNVAILGVCEFAKDNAHCFTLVEEDGVGSLLDYSHTKTSPT